MKKNGFVEAVTQAVEAGNDLWYHHYYYGSGELNAGAWQSTRQPTYLHLDAGAWQSTRQPTYFHAARKAHGEAWVEAVRCTLQMEGILPRILKRDLEW